MPGVRPLTVRDEAVHVYHLYVVQLDLDRLWTNRNEIFAALRAEGIGVNVHYIPVHLHPFYRQQFDTGPGLCPVAEAAYERLITLPLFAHMTLSDADDVIACRGQGPVRLQEVRRATYSGNRVWLNWPPSSRESA